MPTPAAAHKLIASVAVNCTAELYDAMMGNNLYYEAWKKQNPGATGKMLAVKFIKKHWLKCVPLARATLARLLNDPTISEEYKESIMEALELDSTLIAGRANPMKIISALPMGKTE